VGQVLVQRVLANLDALRFEVVEQFADAEPAGWARQQAALEIAQGRQVIDSVALDDVPEDDDVHVLLENADPDLPWDRLDLRLRRVTRGSSRS
jgi:hypothetical protein